MSLGDSGGADLSIFLIAGEASGDRLGAGLMQRLKSLAPSIEFHGIGGPLMEAEGLRSLFPMHELSVMGLAEVLPRLPALFRRRDQAVAEIARLEPDILITIDSPDFCLRVAKRAKAAAPDLITAHYVAPSVWAWRAGRAVKMARYIDHVLALLPFEPDLMRAAGMGCDFVGHPVVSEPRASADDIQEFRARHGLERADIVLVLPGSRGSEVKRMGPVFGNALRRALPQAPDARPVVVAAPAVAETVAAQIRDWPGQPVLVDPRQSDPDSFQEDKRAAFAAADLALAASGTVSLELAAHETPMIIGYDLAPLSRLMIGAMLQVDTVTLVNLVSESRAVPEFLGANCRPEPIGAHLGELLQDPSLREPQFDAMALTMERLGRGQEPPDLRAARAVLRLIG
ncbi:MAG: lipid-A-disaccharide synthase [Pseudomonadota bacterium]